LQNSLFSALTKPLKSSNALLYYVLCQLSEDINWHTLAHKMVCTLEDSETLEDSSLTSKLVEQGLQKSSDNLCSTCWQFEVCKPPSSVVHAGCNFYSEQPPKELSPIELLKFSE
jgi:hypothetical protein